MAVKYTLLPAGLNEPGSLAPAPTLMSLIRVVPSVVPFVIQSSLPVVPSFARKITLSFHTVRFAGYESPSGLMSAINTGCAFTDVVSMDHNSHPMS